MAITPAAAPIPPAPAAAHMAQVETAHAFLLATATLFWQFFKEFLISQLFFFFKLSTYSQFIFFNGSSIPNSHQPVSFSLMALLFQQQSASVFSRSSQCWGSLSQDDLQVDPMGTPAGHAGTPEMGTQANSLFGTFASEGKDNWIIVAISFLF